MHWIASARHGRQSRPRRLPGTYRALTRWFGLHTAAWDCTTCTHRPTRRPIRAEMASGLPRSCTTDKNRPSVGACLADACAPRKRADRATPADSPGCGSTGVPWPPLGARHTVAASRRRVSVRRRSFERSRNREPVSRVSSSGAGAVSQQTRLPFLVANGRHRRAGQPPPKLDIGRGAPHGTRSMTVTRTIRPYARSCGRLTLPAPNS
jgi:hypothetical protein